MSDQDDGQISTLQRPTSDDPKAWRAYWKAQGWPWRTEPEIDAERQKHLAERRAIVPDVAQGIFPFRGIKLSRGDVEWLLATHGNGRGPINWNDVTVIFGFAIAYATLGHLPFLPDSLVFSLTSFHGRGFFPGLGSENSLHNPLVIMAAFEAVIGLLIEISFIATFTQRFFGR